MPLSQSGADLGVNSPQLMCIPFTYRTSFVWDHPNVSWGSFAYVNTLCSLVRHCEWGGMLVGNSVPPPEQQQEPRTVLLWARFMVVAASYSTCHRQYVKSEFAGVVCDM